MPEPGGEVLRVQVISFALSSLARGTQYNRQYCIVAYYLFHDANLLFFFFLIALLTPYTMQHLHYLHYIH